jgi:hypothetical protein
LKRLRKQLRKLILTQGRVAQTIEEINANKAYDLPYDLLIKTLKKRQ